MFPVVLQALPPSIDRLGFLFKTRIGLVFRFRTTSVEYTSSTISDACLYLLKDINRINPVANNPKIYS